ncbi:hypothetical protein [Francisella sp. 19X1-34]|uniref:hypothetical protein n=1 Tax=Francisella sp. 19X1-34 TaxID=3087177 RepID=UPI002E2FB5CC|nr:hypothetical protein [Francisella sp. 19X1-34]MED7787863.1 hypothetical protein [Francisella sp. 19X1-34]
MNKSVIKFFALSIGILLSFNYSFSDEIDNKSPISLENLQDVIQQNILQHQGQYTLGSGAVNDLIGGITIPNYTKVTSIGYINFETKNINIELTPIIKQGKVASWKCVDLKTQDKCSKNTVNNEVEYV